MLPRERVLKAMGRGGIPDRVPFEISWGAFTPMLMKTYREETGSDLEPDDYFDFDTRYVRPLTTSASTDFRRYFPDAELDADTSFDEWGIGSVPTRFEIPDFKYHPLATMTSVKEIESYEWPDLDDERRYLPLRERIDSYHDRGYAVSADMYQTIFETAWLMRGMENLLTDFILNPEIVEAIIERMTSLRVAQAGFFARLGVDIIRLGDDVVTQRGLMFSRETYGKFLKPGLKAIVDAAKKANPSVLVFMHCCGKVEEVIPDFIDCGIDILNPVQPECNDLGFIERTYGDDIAFWGGIGVQSVMPNGSPSDVKNEVLRIQGILGRKGHWLAAPAHILDPAIPWENVIAYVEAVRSATYVQ
ncbi:MAG: uroporphyrinogen decarboxylase family protein [Spirochaetota bacterium]